MNLYGILGIAPDADEETIRAAYRLLARSYHPDVGAGSSSGKFREITEAYRTLIDPERRGSYDRSLERTLSVPVPVEPMIVRPEPLCGSPFHPNPHPHLHSIFDELLRWLEDDTLFFDWPRRW
jgi:curved DNA-binding protein CbpA